jgi:hypothetical protein
MDALVFFLIATLVSTVLLYYSALGRDPETADHGQGSADPRAVLEALIHSSIGRDLTVDLDFPRHLSGHTEVGQCLLLEAEGVLDGASVTVFDQVNEVVETILEGISSPVFEPYLSVWSITDDRSEALILIPKNEPASDQRYGASVELRNTDDGTLMVQLLLCPPALPELVAVLGGDLDLRTGVGSSSPELDPCDGHHDEHNNEGCIQVAFVVIPDVHQEHGRGDDVQDV